MSARDAFHQVVKTALIKEDWNITHDPYPLQAGTFDLAIDLGAEKTIAAERNGRKIAVEIKSFLGSSQITEFYSALGQFLVYRSALTIQEKERQLYLAVPRITYEKFFRLSFIENSQKEHHINLIVYDIDREEIVKWIP
ncbi:element excision factor XisH family protein [Baaleninema simplex]|uniref:element excision factor XisH family protein n=1 Tax=Baaleninema simplex TaxID=2862350 RepID=UPI00035FDEED|nr:element excision factor XisH family protein [Baaleninema simplex]